MSFGEKLTQLRKEKGMSQEDLANSLNVSRQAVSKWESNNSYPETDKIVAICKFFNVSMDEIIGLKEGRRKKDNKTLSLINDYFDKFIKGIKMFYSMTFNQKIKCLIEMCFYALILLIIFIVSRVILIEIIQKLLSILPFELLHIIIQVFDGLYYLIFLVFNIYALVKLYKVRYLDYYENYLEEKSNEEKIVIHENQNKENAKKINIKEEKIIIRDADNIFKPFSWIKKSLIILGKCISLLCVITLSVMFVMLIALIIFTFYFINYGLLITYIVICLFGLLLGIYILNEIFIKFIFNMKQSPKRLFIMFIVACIIVGVSSGLFACELTTYKIIDKKEYNNLKHTEIIDMTDNLVLDLLRYRSADLEIVFEDREDIQVEFYGTEYNISPIHVTYEYISCNKSLVNYQENITKYKVYSYYNYYDYFNGETINEFIRHLLSGVKNKEIISEEDLFYVKPKLYISKDNYQKIKNNISEYELNERLYQCNFSDYYE